MIKRLAQVAHSPVLMTASTGKDKRRVIIGIDLGTTNSLVAVWRDGRPTLIPNALGSHLTPSAVGLGEGDDVLVGLAARERLVTHPARTATAFKRYMGTDREISLGPQTFRPEELSAFVLRSLKADAEAFLGERVDRAIITVPAYFNDAQRKATRAAGEMAGLKVERLLTEPTAAALAYGFDRPTDDETILVVDLGGGTFDVSLLQIFEGVTEVRAAAGDSWLGGEDFVDAIVGIVIETSDPSARPHLADAPKARAALRRQAELAKRRLSEAETATLRLVLGERVVEHEVTREAFELRCEPLLARLRFPIERALRDARIEPDRISRVILAGGASRMPMFRKLIGRIFRRLPLQTINPEEVIALGAAVRAGMLARDSDLTERVMTDVTPFTLGMEVVDSASGSKVAGFFLPIIERNTVIPASRVKRVVNVSDNQTEIVIRVFQGESRFVEDNIALGSLAASIPPGPAGSRQLDVRFTYDSSGLLEVESLAISTGVRRTLVIEGNAGVLTTDEIATRLAALDRLKIHPRDETQNQTLLSRAKRLYEERLGAVREEIGAALARFQGALERQEPDPIRIARGILESVVARFEDDFLR